MRSLPRGIVLTEAHRRGVACRIEPVALERVLAADGLFLTNSVIGVWPVLQLDEKHFPPNRHAAMARAWLMETGA